MKNNILIKSLILNVVLVFVIILIQILYYKNFYGSINNVVASKALLTKYIGNTINYGLIFIFLMNIIINFTLLRKKYEVKKIILFGILYLVLSISLYLITLLITAKTFLI